MKMVWGVRQNDSNDTEETSNQKDLALLYAAQNNAFVLAIFPAEKQMF